MKTHAVRVGAGLLFLVCLLSIIAETGTSCPVCYGETDAKTAEGINLAILLMIGVTGGVLGGILAFIVNVKRRAVRAVGNLTFPRTMN